MSGSNSFDPGAAAPDAHHPSGDPLALTVHDVGAPQLPAQALQRRGRLAMLLLLLACAAPVIASYFTYFVVRPSGHANYAELIVPTRDMPATLALRTLGGQPVTPAALRHQWLLVVVGGGACDATCEARLYDQRQLREMMGREAGRIDRVWLILDDAPVRAPILAAMQSGTPGWVLRADAQALAQWLAPAPGATLGQSLYLVDPMGRWMMRTPADLDPMRFKKDLERLLRASASWDREGRAP